VHLLIFIQDLPKVEVEVGYDGPILLVILLIAPQLLDPLVH